RLRLEAHRLRAVRRRLPAPSGHGAPKRPGRPRPHPLGPDHVRCVSAPTVARIPRDGAAIRRAGSGRMIVSVVDRIDDLSAQARSAAALEAAESYYCSLPWYRNFAATCLDPGDRLALIELSDGPGRPIVLFMRTRPDRFGPL